ncbi:hypothetical protein CEXT_392971 [Caerostris extrusa]|uniref:Uncharacterized protein n=1 Tax=Caerostris extrusa TaxID=172846 RepID=A0AAV4W044_CAEEX|nr:hypothetical protein CEXT_392971 [Caerostris extrusa]
MKLRKINCKKERNEKKGKKKKILPWFLHVRPHSKAAHSMMKITTVSSLRFVTSIYPPVSLIRSLGSPKGVTCSCDTVNLLPKKKDKNCLKEGKKIGIWCSMWRFSQRCLE